MMKIELHHVQVRNQLLYLSVATLVHLEDLFHFLLNFLLEQVLTPFHIDWFSQLLEVLFGQIAEQIAHFDVVVLGDLLNEVYRNLLRALLDTENIEENLVKRLFEELYLIIH